jgi:hypothetical protein
MKINFEEMPSVIFDWIEQKGFSTLAAEQQQEVLKYLSSEEYEELHRTALGVKVSVHKQVSNSRKEELFHHFDRKHRSGRIIGLQSQSLIFWQAAAVLLFLLSGWLFYRIFDVKSDHAIQQMASIDTVYVDREVKSNPEIIHDTVYLYKQLSRSTHENRTGGNATTNHAPEELTQEAEAIEVMSLNDLENPVNNTRGNSMKDDSLLNRYTLHSF